MLARLAHAIAHHRKAVILTWLALTVFGGFSAAQVSHRWLQSFAIPGYPAYEANQRTLDRFGSGETGGPSLLVEALIGGLGALVILFFVFGTLPAVLLPIAIAVTSILNTFTLVWLLTYITDVSVIIQF